MLSLSGITAVHGAVFVVHRAHKTYVLGTMPGVMERADSLSCKSLLMLRQAQREWKTSILFNAYTVRSERVEG